MGGEGKERIGIVMGEPLEKVHLEDSERYRRITSR
jgi:hypothetical protein